MQWLVRGVGAQLDNPLSDSLPCPDACFVANKCQGPNLIGNMDGCLIAVGLQDMVGAGPEFPVAEHQPSVLTTALTVA